MEIKQKQEKSKEELLEELMYSYFKSKGSRFINKNQQPEQGGVMPNSSFPNQVQQKQMAPMLNSIGNT